MHDTRDTVTDQPEMNHGDDRTRGAGDYQPEPWCDLAMEAALAEASAAAQVGEVPVGAVVVYEGRIIARARNGRETDRDPLAHAEILAIRRAAAHLGRWRLTGCSLVVTLEPCPMCAGAIVNARLDQLIFAAFDPRAGAAGSLMDVVRDPRLNHRAAVHSGVRAEAAGKLLRDFFATRRAQNRERRMAAKACHLDGHTLNQPALRGAMAELVEGA